MMDIKSIRCFQIFLQKGKSLPCSPSPQDTELRIWTDFSMKHKYEILIYQLILNGSNT